MLASRKYMQYLGRMKNIALYFASIALLISMYIMHAQHQALKRQERQIMVDEIR